MLHFAAMATVQKDQDLLTSSYNFELPKKLIASRPAANRHSSKLLVFRAKTNQIIHSTYKEIAQFLPSNARLVFNQSQVFPCRLRGHKASGGALEVFILSLIPDHGLYEVMIKASGTRKIGEVFEFNHLRLSIEKLSTKGTFFVSINLAHEDFINFLQAHALIPIPPYIRDGESDEQDKIDYQTIYAKDIGSVAAPTAGLHFTQDIFESLEQKSIAKSFITLHVGAGTFMPVKAENILEHNMHHEYFHVAKQTIHDLNADFGKIFAVGTTTLRVLESIYKQDKFVFNQGENFESTNIFLHPGVKVQTIQGLITNFHLPESSLLMLVSSLIGREKTLELYQVAIKNEYRFYSYGDGMLILLNE